MYVETMFERKKLLKLIRPEKNAIVVYFSQLSH
jgi:hypothetical protein